MRNKETKIGKRERKRTRLKERKRERNKEGKLK
jgi:hypothetical protein